MNGRALIDNPQLFLFFRIFYDTYCNIIVYVGKHMEDEINVDRSASIS